MLKGKKKATEQNFYTLFLDFMDKVLGAGIAYEELVREFDDVQNRVGNLKILETECDMKTHRIIEYLNECKTVPFEREDIYALAKGMDDIVDRIEEVASRFVVFGIEEIRPEALTMATLTLEAIGELKILFEHLHEIKTCKVVKKQIIEVNRIENEGDVVHRSSLMRLFSEEKDPIEIIKWKHLYEEMEEALDACETVANLVQGVMMKA